jgi:hypothetical protein
MGLLLKEVKVTFFSRITPHNLLKVMKKALTDFGIGFLSGLLSLFLNDVMSQSFLFGFSNAQSFLMWLIPALLLLFGYKLLLSKNVQPSNRRKSISSVGMVAIGLGLAYLIGFSLNYLIAGLYVAAIWSK